jgi:hypothetical protein
MGDNAPGLKIALRFSTPARPVFKAGNEPAQSLA